jgi:hypothetical protein
VNAQAKKDFAEKVDTIISLFAKNSGNYDEEVKKILRVIDDSIFNLYSITEIEKKIIITDLKNRINHFGKIYT